MLCHDLQRNKAMVDLYNEAIACCWIHMYVGDGTGDSAGKNDESRTGAHASDSDTGGHVREEAAAPTI